MATHMPPMPMANAGARDRPGQWDSAMPPTAPTNMDGKTMPPRKQLMDTP